MIFPLYWDLCIDNIFQTYREHRNIVQLYTCKGITLLLSCINFHLHDLSVANVPVSIGLIVAVSVVVPIGPIGLPILVGVSVRMAVVVVTSQELGGKCLDQQYQEES